MATTFDAAAYKESTRQQWDEAAEAWHRWGPFLEEWLGEATELMLDLAGVVDGARVLDVAAGAGGQTIAAARRVGPSGAVLATDISERILEHAAEEARRQGFPNVAVQTVDTEELDVTPASFDAAISRLGLIYFPDRAGALARILSALRPGGRFATVTYSVPERNGFFAVPVSIVRRRAELPPPPPGAPGPFSLAAAGVLDAEFRAAGFVDVDVRIVTAPVVLASAAECARFERESFGALHQMLGGLDESGRRAAWEEVEQALGEYQTADGFVGPCELLVAAGTRPALDS
jgi:SAM-dependent methyltransferase